MDKLVVVVCMVGPKPNYNWFAVFAQFEGEFLSTTVKRAEAWGREKAQGGDSVWTEQADVRR